jgi:hypothetical protein
MKKIVVLLTLFVLAFILAIRRPSNAQAALIHALQFQNAPEEGKGCSVPKAWGQLKGVADRGIAFEDSAGTIRVLDIGPCMRGQTQLIVKVNRQ